MFLKTVSVQVNETISALRHRNFYKFHLHLSPKWSKLHRDIFHSIIHCRTFCTDVFCTICILNVTGIAIKFVLMMTFLLNLIVTDLEQVCFPLFYVERELLFPFRTQAIQACCVIACHVLRECHFIYFSSTI